MIHARSSKRQADKNGVIQANGQTVNDLNTGKLAQRGNKDNLANTIRLEWKQDTGGTQQKSITGETNLGTGSKTINPNNRKTFHNKNGNTLTQHRALRKVAPNSFASISSRLHVTWWHII